MTYSVVGIYEETGQRFCHQVVASDPAEAERKVTDEYDDAIVAGVFEGELIAVDVDPVMEAWS